MANTKDDRAAASGDDAAAEARVAAEVQHQCKVLNAEIAALKARVAAEYDGRQMAEEIVDDYKTRLGEVLAERDQARADLARVTAEHDALKLDNDSFLEGSEDARAACDKLTAELAEAKALLTEAVDIAKGIRGCAERGAPNITWQDWWARLQKVEAIVAAGGEAARA